MTLKLGGGGGASGGGGGGGAPALLSGAGAGFTGAGGIPLLVLMVIVAPGNACPEGEVPTMTPLAAPLATGVG